MIDICKNVTTIITISEESCKKIVALYLEEHGIATGVSPDDVDFKVGVRPAGLFMDVDEPYFKGCSVTCAMK